MKHMDIRIEEAEGALVEKPLFATSVERVLILDEIKSQHGELPQPLRFAAFLSHLLSRVSVPLEAHDVIAGRCVDRELDDDEEAIFAALIKHPDYPKRRVMLDSGHCVYDWEMLIEEGLGGIYERARRVLSTQEDSERRIFLEGLMGVLKVIRDYMLRYAEAAEAAGMEALAASLRAASWQRPTSFRDALQLLWIVTLIDCAYITPNPTLTLGRLDQLLFPLYEADMASGRLTRREAAVLITDYYCKHNLIMGRGEHQVGDAQNSTTFQRIYCFDAPQYLLLAGTDSKGQSAVNDLTLLFAECIRPRFKNPVVVIRYFAGLDTQHPELWQVLTDRALKSASLMFYNDDNLISAFRRMGLPEEDSRGYAHFGCNWATTGSNGAWMQGGPNSRTFGACTAEERKVMAIPYMRMNAEHGWGEDFVLAAKSLLGRESVTIDDLYDAFFSRWTDFIERKLDYLSRELTIRQRRPAALLTFGDCFYRDSVDHAACFAADAKYHFELQSFQMFGTVADCFIVTDKLVFLDKKLTLAQLLEAVEANFKGHERVLAMCRSVEKYGSDTPHSNAHVKRLSHGAMDIIYEKSRPYFEKQRLFLEPCMQSDTWHLKLGALYGATPDGRLAGAAFSQNSRPANGSSINGLGGMFNAMLNLPVGGMVSGALNLDVDPRQFRGEEGRALFAAALATYFNRGGLHAQVSSVSVDDLRAAKLDPDSYRDLRVRVTGYSGVFVDMCERLQDDVIERLGG